MGIAKFLKSWMKDDVNGFFSIDENGNFISANEGLVNIIGFSHEELQKKSIWCFFSPQESRRIKKFFEEALSGVPQKFEVTFLTGNDENAVLEISLSGVCTEGEVNRIFGMATDRTGQRSAERALRSSSKRFATLIQQGSDIISILDSQGVFTCVSENSFSILGLKPEYFVGKLFYGFIHPDDRRNLQREFDNLKETWEQKEQIFRIKNAAGNWRWMEAKARDLRDESSINGIVVNSRDITESFIAKKALEESEQKYRAFFENSLDGILLTAPTGEIYAANPKACEMFQMSEEELCRRGRSGIVDQSDPRIQSAIEERNKRGATFSEINMIRNDGSIFPAEVSSSTYNDINGKIRSSIIIRDISEKKFADERLKASEKEYQLLFENNPLPNWIYDRSTLQILNINEAAINHYGYSKKEFLEMRITDLRPEEEVPDLFNFLEKWKNEVRVVMFGNAVHVKKNQELIDVEVSGYHLTYAGKQCTMVVCNDVTERNQVLQRLKKKREKLLTAQEIAKIGSWEVDLKKEKFSWTQEVFRIWGRKAERFSPTFHNFYTTIHPQDLDDFKNEFLAFIKGEKDLATEFRIIAPDLSERWVHARGKLFGNGLVEDATQEGTFQDITERKTFIENLRTSEARFRGIVDSQTNYLTRIDLHGNYSYVNEKFKKDFSWFFPDGSPLGKSALSTLEESDFLRAFDAFETWVSNPNTVHQIELKKLQKDGECRSTLWDFICIADSEGNPLEVQGVGIDITGRVKAEKLLLESNERYERISKATSDAIYDYDCKTGKIFWSEGYNLLVGISEFSPTPNHIDSWTKAIHPEDHSVISDLDAALKGNRNNWKAEYRLKRANGEYAYVLERGSIVRDEHNNAIRMVGVVSDVSEQKKLQALLDKASQLARIGSFERDFLTDELYWSPIIREIVGISPNKAVDFNSSVAFYKEGEHRRKIEEGFRLAVEKNIPFDIESIIVTEQGKECWVRTIGQPEFIDGKCIRLSGSFQDIDETRRAQQEATKASEERESILESIGDAFFALNKEWEVTYWNSQAEKALQCSKESIVGQKLFTFFNIHDTPFETYYLKAVEDNKTQHFEAFLDKTQSWYEVNIYPSADGLSVFFKDVTEIKDTNYKLKELNKNLKTYTDELVAANKGLEQFSYIVSHNLRAPVANILGLANLLEDGENPENIQKQILEGLVDNVTRLDRVMYDLNHILQVKHEFSEKKELVNIQELVFSIKSSLQAIIEKEQVRIELNLWECSEINTIPGYMHSIFYNLIFNAIKYRKTGVTPVIKIQTKAKKDKILILFKDNGMGIDLNKRKDQIFGLYKRFHQHVEGKGIGLFMVKTQVEMLGGRIHVSSEVGEGTTFTIELGVAGKIKKKEGKNETIYSS